MDWLDQILKYCLGSVKLTELSRNRPLDPIRMSALDRIRVYFAYFLLYVNLT